MKAYVNFFEVKQVKDDAPLYAQPEMIVQYSILPDHWKMSWTESQHTCGELNDGHVHAVKWPEHLCHFEVEEVGQEVFAIVCNSHPDWRAAESTIES